MAMSFARAQNVDLHWTSPVKERYVTFYAEPQGKPPEEMAYLICPSNPDPRFLAEWGIESQTNQHLMHTNRGWDNDIIWDFNKAVWVPFKTNLLVDFGPGDGGRWLWVSYRNNHNQKPQWNAYHIILQSLPPAIVITDPKSGITSQPMIQLSGYMTSDMDSTLRFDVFNQNGDVTGSGEAGFSNRSEDSDLWALVKDNFQCLDVQLSPGTNTIVLSGTDSAGFSIKTNLSYVFTTVGDTNPPVFKLAWPEDGMSISGSQFDLYGQCDDPTAVVTALLCNDEGHSTRLEGFVERNGCLWVERVPVAKDRNYITVVTTDAAQNSSLTNLVFTKSGMTLYMDAVPDPNKLWQPNIDITGYCSLTNRTVMVNGVKAKMNADGHWAATHVPVRSPNGGGTASFDIKTDPDDDTAPPTNSWLPTVCGVPANSLSAGISIMPASTNEYNHYRICLGYTNTSGGNIPNLNWMLPREESRFVLHLYDQTNKEIAQREYYEKSGQSMATNVNLHHLGKNELTNIDGIIAFTTNGTVRIAALNLDQHYQLPSPGDYRLEVGLQLFKIAGDGQLIPFEFPAVATTLHIIDQASEMTFYLNGLQQQGKLAWGAERDGLRIGVVHGMKWRQISDANQIGIFLQNTGTNDYRNLNLRFPNPSEQCDVILYDSNGKEIPKTALGKQLGQPLSLDGQPPPADARSYG